MFYLPFEHGPKALHLLTEFQWLQTNSHAMHQSNNPETVKTRVCMCKLIKLMDL